MKIAAFTILCLFSITGPLGLSQDNSKAVYKDPNAAIPDRVRDLLSRMTVEEKVAQLESNWTLPAFPGFSMPSPFEGDHLNEAIRSTLNAGRKRTTLMYVATLVLLMLVLPALSIAIEAATTHGPLSLLLIGRWFVFWSVGMRLLLAGVRQIVQPGYTAQVILHLKHGESRVVVRELGFANVAIGLVGLGSLFWRAWAPAGAMAGAAFYLLAGLNHIGQRDRGALESAAMVSDLFAGAILAIVFGALLGLSH